MSQTPDRSRDAKRRIFALIERVHAAVPSFRLGQIIANVLAESDHQVPEVYYVEDQELEALLARYCLRYSIP